MRVLHVAPTPFFSDRGCHIRIRGLIHALDRAGVQNLLCTYHLGREVDGVTTRRTWPIPGYSRLEAGPSGFTYLADVLLFWVVLREVLRFRPDVIHGHLHEGALIGWAASKVFFWKRIPVVFDMQGSLVGELEQHAYVRQGGWKRRMFVAIERFVDHRPDRIACSSAASQSVAAREFGVPGERLHIVPDGFDVAPAHPRVADELRQTLGFPPEQPVLVYTGALLPVKGLDRLHEVLAGVADRDLAVNVLLVGYPVEATQAFIGRHGLADRCRLAGRIPFERLGDYLALGCVAIEPKDADSGEASGKLVNYMAAGLPVLCFDTDNNRAMLGTAGIYAPRGDVAQLLDGLEQLLGNPALRARLSREARQRARERHSWDASAATLVAVYGELTKKQ